ncbi:MAG: tetratricopeptide repeat protein [Planctomycetota bacterium]|jgi:Flp pilus assembly protein TadD
MARYSDYNPRSRERTRAPGRGQRRPRYQPKKNNKWIIIVVSIVGALIMLGLFALRTSSRWEGDDDDISIRGGAHSLKGVSKMNNEDYRGAVAEFDRAIEIDPQFAMNYSLRGMSKIELEDFSGALADFNSAIRLDPTEETAYVGRGLVRMNQDDSAGAIADFNSAISIDPQCAEAYFARGTLKMTMGDDDGAQADLEMAARLEE